MGSSTTTADENDEFTDGDPQTQVPCTWVMAAWLNTLQRELVHLCEEAGITIDPEDDTQVYQAITQLLNTSTEGMVKTVNSKSPDDQGKIELTASDVDALPSGGTAAAATKLATAHKIAGHPFDGTADITISAGDVDALPSGGTAAAASKLSTAHKIAGHPFDGTADITISAGDVDALPSGGTAAAAAKLATAHKIAGHPFDGTADITIAAGDVGAYTKAESDSRYLQTLTLANTGAVGTLALLCHDTALGLGATAAGSELFYSGFAAQKDSYGDHSMISRLTSPQPTGTWKCLGVVPPPNNNDRGASLFCRIA
ncbi:hypothetical protein [Lelliottia aquatilis]|uniref:hypothetical protein n=1 Tax=Lelliottia aquatilis TaxID=2080838 RepID=UPI003B8A84D3